MLLNVTTRLFNSFRRNEDGQDLLEYALLVALIAIVAVAARHRGRREGRRDLQRHRREAAG